MSNRKVRQESQSPPETRVLCFVYFSPVINHNYLPPTVTCYLVATVKIDSGAGGRYPRAPHAVRF
jgi:hypothetical protein